MMSSTLPIHGSDDAVIPFQKSVYYAFESGYTSRLLDNPNAEETVLAEEVVDVFDSNRFDGVPLFIYDDVGGDGLYLFQGDKAINLGEKFTVADVFKRTGDPDLYFVISHIIELGATVCFSRTSTYSLLPIMEEIEYCNIFSVEEIETIHTPGGKRFIVEQVDSESG